MDRPSSKGAARSDCEVPVGEETAASASRKAYLLATSAQPRQGLRGKESVKRTTGPTANETSESFNDEVTESGDPIKGGILKESREKAGVRVELMCSTATPRVISSQTSLVRGRRADQNGFLALGARISKGNPEVAAPDG